MSYFLFGDFSAEGISKKQILKLKKELGRHKVFIQFDEEIQWKDIEVMLQQNPSELKYHFCLTSANQPTNGTDLLLPWEEYSFEELFPNGTDDWSVFVECAAKILDRTKWALQQMVLYFQVREMRVFVVVGYDIHFEIVSCSLEEMFEGLKRQMREIGDFEDPSRIYQIRIT